MKKYILLSITIACIILAGCKKKEDTIKPGSIYGTVVDKSSQASVSGAGVELMPKGLKTITGSDGSFQFTQIDPGDYNLYVTKTGYQDLKSSAISVKSGETAKADVQLEKKPSSLQIMDNDGNIVTELDFGGEEGVLSKTFKLFNIGTESFNFNIGWDVEWIQNVTPSSGNVPVNGNCPVILRIDREKLAYGLNRTSIIITAETVGGVELKVKARKGPSGDYVELPAARLLVQIEDLGRVNWNSAMTLCQSSTVGDFNNWRLPTKEELGTLYTNREYIGGFTIGKYWSSDNGGGSNYYYENFDNGVLNVCDKDSLLYVRAVISLNETVPAITTTEPSNITTNSAETGGTIIYNGVAEITVRGVCWGTTHNPSVEGNHTEDGSGPGTFKSNLSNLQLDTKYYVRAYATNEIGTYYGEEKEFTTNDGNISVVTKEVTEITATSASCGGNITVPSGNTFPITSRGVCWCTNHNPTTTNSHTSDGTGSGQYTSSITGLTVNTKYYVRAYATNEIGTFYGEERDFTTVEGMPTVTTKLVSNITPLSATSGGNVTSDGGFNVTERGICWSTYENPTIGDNHKAEGTGLGEYNSTMSDLLSNVTYYVRAYATNANGTVYGQNETFTTVDGSLTVTTSNITNITPTSAMSGGTITAVEGNNLAVTARGVCYSTNHNPTINDNYTSDGTGIGSFTSSIINLTLNTTYYVRAYAINELGIYYGEEKTFTTNDGSMIVTTAEVSDVTPTAAMCGGIITIPAGNTFSVTARGVCWAINHNPTTSDSHTSDGTGDGSFTSAITGLIPNTTYYVRAYATNELGTYYGEEKSFITTEGLPEITTKNVTNVAPLSATCGGIVTSDNGFAITERGVCWSLVSYPTIDDNHTTNGSGTGEFSILIENLQNSTTYHVRAYATNANGTTYGEDKSFTTTSGEIIVATHDVTGISPTSATCGGSVSITDDNNLPITARGVCWSINHNPSLNDNHTNDGTGVGVFTSSLSGLDICTIYYVKAYATNQLGTFYGNETFFSTTDGKPSVSLDINSFAIISNTSISCISNVINDGGFDVSTRGVCWSTVPLPTVSDNHTTDGSGTGYYSSVLIGLDANTTYYVRSYATNSMGTSYSEQHTLTAEYRDYLSLPRMQYDGYTYVIYPDFGDRMTQGNARSMCSNLTYAGFDDWYLPDRYELFQMYLNRDVIGGFNTENNIESVYWSNTYSGYSGGGINHYYTVQFSNGVVNDYGSTNNMFRARAIRKINNKNTK